MTPVLYGNRILVMPTDPNWLYSTIAQSSAAIVAIIGGFITASVLSLSAEKRSLINQKKDKVIRLETLGNEKEELSREFDTKENASFIASISDKLINSKNVPTFEDLINENPEAQNLNHESLRREYQIFRNKVLQAKDFITKNLQAITLKSGALVDWAKMNQLDISKYDYKILESLYNKVQDQEQESLSSLEQALLPPTLLRMRLPYIVPIAEQQESERLRQNIKADTSESLTLERDVRDLDFRISKFSYPPNLGWGIGVLGFLAVFGILLPVLIISGEAFYPWAKLLTLITFWLGLIGVFAYIVFQIRTLKKR